MTKRTIEVSDGKKTRKPVVSSTTTTPVPTTTSTNEPDDSAPVECKSKGDTLDGNHLVNGTAEQITRNNCEYWKKNEATDVIGTRVDLEHVKELMDICDKLKKNVKTDCFGNEFLEYLTEDDNCPDDGKYMGPDNTLTVELLNDNLRYAKSIIARMEGAEQQNLDLNKAYREVLSENDELREKVNTLRKKVNDLEHYQAICNADFKNDIFYKEAKQKYDKVMTELQQQTNIAEHLREELKTTARERDELLLENKHLKETRTHLSTSEDKPVLIYQPESTSVSVSNQEPVTYTTDSDNYEYVNHPSHYNKYDVETIEMMRRIWGDDDVKTWAKLSAFKYRMRLGEKPDTPIERDLEKERFYLRELHK